MEKILEVKNLTISFRTMNGKVQAVRDISFDLNKGETLAIVGESGSGKSVTSKAIMGISAINAMIESGEILYDGRDLTKISEEQFHELRGNKISMIFQDPLSSLNPIMRIGKQLTEAMILNGRSTQRNAKKDFNNTLKVLNENIIESFKEENSEELNKKCEMFNQFEIKHTKLEIAYNQAKESLTDALEEMKVLAFEIEKKAADRLVKKTKICVSYLKKAYNTYVVPETNTEYTNKVSSLVEIARAANKAGYDSEEMKKLHEELTWLINYADEVVNYTQPNFFSMAYYLEFSGQALPEMSTLELNAFLREYLDKNYMLDFIKYCKGAIINSHKKSMEKKKAIVEEIDKILELFNSSIERSQFEAAMSKLTKDVENAIDRLEINKNSTEYTFNTCIQEAIYKVFNGLKLNIKEERRFKRDTAKFNAIVKRGKTPTWNVMPLSLVNIEASKKDIKNALIRLKEVYEAQISDDTIDFDAKAIALIDYFKEQASKYVYKVTEAMAKIKAIKLMEEVGIPEARKRYYQYPFEFSGGMRQRIVIAIALAANPDLLICDEPTTALDVTIQSQILELINKIKRERKLSIIFITHDLGVVANMADKIAVMYAGKIVETGTSNDIFYDPRHPYTWALLSSMPDLDTNERLEAIPGTPPNMIFPPKGDAFAERNKYALKIDYEVAPPMFKVSDTHYAATWLLHPDAPKMDAPKTVTDRIARMKEKAKQYAEGGNE